MDINNNNKDTGFLIFDIIEGLEDRDEWLNYKTIKTECQTLELLFTDCEEKRLLLTCDKYMQFLEGEDEQIYHETLTKTVFNKAQNKNKCLILGGGDFLACRNILKLNQGIEITLVDYDKGITDLCSQEKLITAINECAFKKVKNIINADAKKWVPKCKEKYDFIIVDFPDPTNDVLEQLYTESFLSQICDLLEFGGSISIQCNITIIDEMEKKMKNILKETVRLPYEMPYMGCGTILIGVK